MKRINNYSQLAQALAEAPQQVASETGCVPMQGIEQCFVSGRRNCPSPTQLVRDIIFFSKYRAAQELCRQIVEWCVDKQPGDVARLVATPADCVFEVFERGNGHPHEYQFFLHRRVFIVPPDIDLNTVRCWAENDDPPCDYFDVKAPIYSCGDEGTSVLENHGKGCAKRWRANILHLAAGERIENGLQPEREGGEF